MSKDAPPRPRTWRDALSRAGRAWSHRAFEARVVFAALLTGLVSARAHLDELPAIVSAILVLQPDPALAHRHTALRFVTTLVGGGASVAAVAFGLHGLLALAAGLALTVTACALLDLEEGLRPACICTVILLARPDVHFARAEEMDFLLQRLLSVMAGALVALALSHAPGWRPEVIAAARGERSPEQR